MKAEGMCWGDKEKRRPLSFAQSSGKEGGRFTGLKALTGKWLTGGEDSREGTF